MNILAEQDLTQFVDHQDQAEGQKPLREMIAADHAFDEDLLEQDAQHEGDCERADDRQREAAVWAAMAQAR